ncbi:hypothetical protein [Paraflavitalea soli]|nr:hypothetical protein [Paraflavitalea soli]
MPSTLVIFNGLTFSYTTLDRAIAWAKEHKATLRVLLLKDQPVEEDYVFPSDIAAAESLTDIADAQQDDEQLLQGKIKLVKDKAIAAGIDHVIQVSGETSVDGLLAIAGKTDLIFVDAGGIVREGAAGLPFDMNELIEKAACPVELVTEK